MHLTEQIDVGIKKTTEQVTEQATEQVKKLLECLKTGPLGTRQIMQSLELSHRPTFLYTYLQPALQADLIEMTQPDTPKSPTQKYRLTVKGQQIKNKGIQII